MRAYLVFLFLLFSVSAFAKQISFGPFSIEEPTTLIELKNAVNALELTDEEDRWFLEEIRQIVNGPHFTTRLRRDRNMNIENQLDSYNTKYRSLGSHIHHRIQYAINSFKRIYNNRTPVPTIDIEPRRQCENPIAEKIVPSVIPFKRGDYARLCRVMINQANRLNLRNLMVFHPVHYSGAHESSYNYEPRSEVVSCRETKSELLRTFYHLRDEAYKARYQERGELSSEMRLYVDFFTRSSLRHPYAGMRFPEPSAFNQLRELSQEYKRCLPILDRDEARQRSLLVGHPPREHWNYQYESSMMPTREEFNQCISDIESAGLNLHFAPHSESITLINLGGETEMRATSNLPFDESFVENHYGPLLSYYRANPRTGRTPTIALGAEMGHTMAQDPVRSLRLVRSLREQFREVGAEPVFSFNPLGAAEGAVGSCDDQIALLQEYDEIAPTIYEHNIKNNWEQTRNSSQELLAEWLARSCTGIVNRRRSTRNTPTEEDTELFPVYSRMLEVIQSKPFHAGEFGNSSRRWRSDQDNEAGWTSIIQDSGDAHLHIWSSLENGNSALCGPNPSVRCDESSFEEVLSLMGECGGQELLQAVNCYRHLYFAYDGEASPLQQVRERNPFFDEYLRGINYTVPAE